MKHFSSVSMIDVGDKPTTQRETLAKGIVRMKPSTATMILNHELPKGDVLTAAQVAGILAAKNTPHIIPLCHPLLLSNIGIEFHTDEQNGQVEISALVRCQEKTGVEMEALTAVTVSALTIYDMCKGVDPSMHIENIRVVKKSGGKSGSVQLE
ncbi:MAG: cyclic pyranopterin monophosphate synthase MoaC [Chloroflexota bacterium]|nr:cyclic pyranopterin monophosphate synthase MoaC [Chloroflexota bacterium]